MKSSKFDFHIARPFVFLGRAVAILTLLLCIVTPFVDDLPSRWTFLFVGIGYSAFLSFLVTGILLLPQPWRSRAFTALLVAGALAPLVPGSILAIIHFRLPLSFIHYVTQPLLWGLYVFIAAMVAFACYGWYHRLTHDAPNVA